MKARIELGGKVVVCDVIDETRRDVYLQFPVTKRCAWVPRTALLPSNPHTSPRTGTLRRA